MEGTLRELIAGVAAGAAEGAEALRRAGQEVRLDDFQVEAVIDSGDGSASTLALRLHVVVGTQP